MPLALTPFIRRKESPHGQGVITYGQDNVLHIEAVGKQEAPDPIRQSDTPSRPAKRQVAIMSTRPKDWKSGFADAFIPYMRVLTLRQSPNQILQTRAMNAVGVRPNISRPPAIAYGSLFAIPSTTYDVVNV